MNKTKYIIQKYLHESIVHPQLYREQWYDSEPADWHIYYKYNLEKKKQKQRNIWYQDCQHHWIWDQGSRWFVLHPNHWTKWYFLLPSVVVSVWTSCEGGPPCQLRLCLRRLLFLPSGGCGAQSHVLFRLFRFLWLLHPEKIKGKKSLPLSHPSKVGCMPAASVVYGVIQQRSLFAREYGKCMLKGKTKGTF